MQKNTQINTILFFRFNQLRQLLMFYPLICPSIDLLSPLGLHLFNTVLPPKPWFFQNVIPLKSAILCYPQACSAHSNLIFLSSFTISGC